MDVEVVQFSWVKVWLLPLIISALGAYVVNTSTKRVGSTNGTPSARLVSFLFSLPRIGFNANI
jgi:hypothetical protein